MQVVVPSKEKLEIAIRIFKRKSQKEGILREARRRKEYEKPSEKQKRKLEESISRRKRKKYGH